MGKRFELTPDWNIYTALESRESLLTWASEENTKGHDYLEISAANVAEIDGAGLQLLVALGNQGIEWRLTDASEAFKAACRTLGCTAWLASLKDGSGS